jgi:hypothetical protein
VRTEVEVDANGHRTGNRRYHYIEGLETYRQERDQMGYFGVTWWTTWVHGLRYVDWLSTGPDWYRYDRLPGK